MRRLALGLVLVALAACEAMPAEKPGTAGNPAPAPATGSAALPAGAISIGDDTYMVPAGRIEGCPSFRPYSPTKMVVQVIQYRRRGGGFTANRADADCTAR